MYKVHKNYWLRLSETNSNDEDHKRHLDKSDSSFETLRVIREVMSDYYKTATQFIIIYKAKSKIPGLLLEIKNFVPLKAAEYKNLVLYEDIKKAANDDEAKLNENYKFYSKKFDEIYTEMKLKFKIY